MAITRQQRLIHRAFLRRADQYERRYARRFLSVLAKQYREAAEAYPQPYTVNPDDYRPVLIQLYTTVLPQEAKVAWDMFVKPLAGDRKDFFDDLAGLLGFNVPQGEFIRLWRDISREWLTVNILTKINSISQTTQRAIAKVVESAINEGSSIPDIAKEIRQQSQGEVNRHRSVVIARTETISAMGKGRRLSMFTSNLLWNHRWVDTKDERTRLSHKAIAQEDWRPLDQPYWLVNKSGSLEEMDYPGDPKGSAENVIQCRCCEVFEVQRDASGRPRRRSDSPVTVNEALEVIG